MTVSLADILTTAKNLVVAVNNLGQTYKFVNGIYRSAPIGPSTTVNLAQGQGRFVSMSVIYTTGGTTGTVYDCTSTTTLTNEMDSIPAATAFYSRGIPFSNGLTVATTAGMTVIVVYSTV